MKLENRLWTEGNRQRLSPLEVARLTGMRYTGPMRGNPRQPCVCLRRDYFRYQADAILEDRD